MESVLLSQKQMERFLTEGLKGIQFNQTDSQYTFNTTIDLIQALESLKKKGTCQYAVIRRNLSDFCNSGICQLELNQYELVKLWKILSLLILIRAMQQILLIQQGCCQSLIMMGVGSTRVIY